MDFLAPCLFDHDELKIHYLGLLSPLRLWSTYWHWHSLYSFKFPSAAVGNSGTIQHEMYYQGESSMEQEFIFKKVVLSSLR